MARWYEKASVQTALVSGIILILVSMGGGLLSLYKDNQRLIQGIQDEIDNTIIEFSDNALKASREAIHIELTPELMTSEEALNALKRVNQEAAVYETVVNLTKMHRLIKKYGKEETRERFVKVINEYANAHNQLNEFLQTLLDSYEREKRISDVEKANQTYGQYVNLLNSRTKKRTEIHTFVANLTSDDFDIE